MAWGFSQTVKSKTGNVVEKPVTYVRNFSSPFWRSALANTARRCLVPVTAFSEYGSGKPGKLPLPWFDVPSRPIFSFAGIWCPMTDSYQRLLFSPASESPRRSDRPESLEICALTTAGRADKLSLTVPAQPLVAT